MTFQQTSYLPAPAPGPNGPNGPPGLRPSPQGYQQLCPGVPLYFLEEHKSLVNNAGQVQGQMQRPHLELGSAHTRINGKEDRLVHTEARLDYLEGQRSEDLRKSEGHLSDIVQDLGNGDLRLGRWSEQLQSLEKQYQDLQEEQRRYQEQLEVQS